MVINIKQMQIKLGVFLMFAYCVFVSLFSRVVPNPYARGMMVFAGFSLILLLPLGNKMMLVPSDLFMVLFMVVASTGLVRGGRDTIYSIASMLPFMMLYFLVRLNGEWLASAHKLLLVMELIYAGFTYLFFFGPTRLYQIVAYILFTSNIERLVMWYDSGCMAGLTSHYSTNGIIMATGSLLTFGEMRAHWDEDSRKKWVWAALFVYMFVALLLTGKRGPLIFCTAGLFVIYFFSMENEQGKRITNTLGIVVAVFCIGAILVTWVPALSRAFYRFAETSEDGDMTMGRTRYWELAWQLFKENPLTGIGWGRFRLYTESMYRKKMEAHNVFLQLLCENGIFGLVAFLAMYIQPFRFALREYIAAVRNRETDTQKKSLLAFAVGYQVYFILYCFTGNPVFNQITFMPYYFTCAIAAYYHLGAGRKSLE